MQHVGMDDSARMHSATVLGPRPLLQACCTDSIWRLANCLQVEIERSMASTGLSAAHCICDAQAIPRLGWALQHGRVLKQHGSRRTGLWQPILGAPRVLSMVARPVRAPRGKKMKPKQLLMKRQLLRQRCAPCHAITKTLRACSSQKSFSILLELNTMSDSPLRCANIAKHALFPIMRCALPSAG